MVFPAKGVVGRKLLFSLQTNLTMAPHASLCHTITRSLNNIDNSLVNNWGLLIGELRRHWRKGVVFFALWRITSESLTRWDTILNRFCQANAPCLPLLRRVWPVRSDLAPTCEAQEEPGLLQLVWVRMGQRRARCLFCTTVKFTGPALDLYYCLCEWQNPNVGYGPKSSSQWCSRSQKTFRSAFLRAFRLCTMANWRITPLLWFNEDASLHLWPRDACMRSAL